MATKMQIRVIDGMYKDEHVRNTVFTMFEDCTADGYVVVNGDRWGRGKVRVKVDGNRSYEILTPGVPAQAEPVMAEPAVSETDEEILTRLGERFEMLDEMTRATINGDVRAMIVQGPPGVGKSFGVTTQLERANLFEDVAGRPAKYEVVKGAMTAIGLYVTLYKHSDEGHVLVFDDCDSILQDELSLNILKAALDSGKKRRIFWNSDSNLLRREGVPDSFDFKGSVIFITNIKFDNIKSKKLLDHLEALQSRCHFLDLTMNTLRERLLRIRQIAGTGNLFTGYNFSDEQSKEVLDFMTENQNKLREVSLRMALKIADLVKISTNWRNMARATCMR
jgi:hypothetical protein